MYDSSLSGSSPSQLSDTVRSALTVLTEAAKDDNHARMYLGFCYQRGNGVGVDEKKAAELYSMATSQGHCESQYWLGEMYLHGRGVPKDKAIAEDWLTKAAEGGRDDADKLLSKMRGEVNGGGGV